MSTYNSLIEKGLKVVMFSIGSLGLKESPGTPVFNPIAKRFALNSRTRLLDFED